MKKVYEFLKQAGVWYLATAEGDQPRVRPFGAVCIFEDRLYIHTGLKKPVAKQMLANPKVEISGMAGGRWIRLTAEAVPDERMEAQEAVLEANPSLKRMYAAGDGNTAVFFLKNAKAEIRSFTEEPERHQF
ncbi:pyridoxamine 5'-phosphate oxidase family protein [Lachnoclostridium sp. Marseille-P6806]|uniref:pyridoxamine 5'-phosphate oxidase family protein n=1 Tax=Lachnoclostridium sp. Marseille-P6806 TaxID=2364793 RepID=UPI00102FF97F|nr:pyridoxamine 5'-phosphate oxidase family protein [Lachnoclostridium sp. Marseille-P6806]